MLDYIFFKQSSSLKEYWCNKRDKCASGEWRSVLRFYMGNCETNRKSLVQCQRALISLDTRGQRATINMQPRALNKQIISSFQLIGWQIGEEICSRVKQSASKLKYKSASELGAFFIATKIALILSTLRHFYLFYCSGCKCRIKSHY